ncbi:sensor histidine kinase [Lysobacter xanthus]
MSTDAPESPPRHRRQATLLLVPVALIAFGVPFALHLAPHAQAVVAVAVLGASAFAAAAIERLYVQSPRRAPPATSASTDATVDPTLAERLERQRIELETLARRLMTVQEDERASLSRELHDDVGQAITAIKLCASSLAHEPDPPRRAVVLETAQEIAAIADQTVAKLRDLSLLLRPPQLDALGLEAALRWQASTLFRSDLPRLELRVPTLDCRPPRDVELACFRIAQEALTNVIRHARAGRVVLELTCDHDELRLSVEDDGCGIAPDHRAGLGQITMRERARQVGGRLDVDSRPGRTRIEAVLPVPADEDPRTGVLRG